jgi:hypothetical protein
MSGPDLPKSPDSKPTTPPQPQPNMVDFGRWRANFDARQQNSSTESRSAVKPDAGQIRADRPAARTDTPPSARTGGADRAGAKPQEVKPQDAKPQDAKPAGAGPQEVKPHDQPGRLRLDINQFRLSDHKSLNLEKLGAVVGQAADNARSAQDRKDPSAPARLVVVVDHAGSRSDRPGQPSEFQQIRAKADAVGKDHHVEVTVISPPRVDSTKPPGSVLPGGVPDLAEVPHPQTGPRGPDRVTPPHPGSPTVPQPPRPVPPPTVPRTWPHR